jgi:hypothetical protein
MDKTQAYREIAGYSALSILYQGVYAVEYLPMSFDFSFRKSMGDELLGRYHNIDLRYQESPDFIIDRFSNHPRRMAEQARWNACHTSTGDRSRSFYVPCFEIEWYNERAKEGEDLEQLVAEYVHEGDCIELFEMWKPFGKAFLADYAEEGTIIPFRNAAEKTK